MIVVLDTNVIVSSALSSKGPPAEITTRWEAGEFDVATSYALLEELERALKYKRVRKYFKKPEKKTSDLLKLFRAVGVLVKPSFTLNVIEEDPDDNRVLECARAAGAAYIVTGDRHLLRLKEFEGIVILSPIEFLAILKLEGRKGN